MKILVFLVIFLLLGGFFIISDKNLNLRKGEDRNELGKLYLAWLGNVFDNLKQATGYVVKLDWLPD